MGRGHNRQGPWGAKGSEENALQAFLRDSSELFLILVGTMWTTFDCTRLGVLYFQD